MDAHNGTIALSEIEWRSYSILAETTKTISRAAIAGRSAVLNSRVQGQLFMSLKSLNSMMRNFLQCINTSETIAAFENASPEKVSELVDQMDNVQERIGQIVIAWRPKIHGFWSRLFNPQLTTLESHCVALQRHVHALRASEIPILLKRQDQERIVQALLDPPSPNSELRRALSR